MSDHLRISLPLVDGGLFPFECDSGKEVINELFGDDWGAPPRGLSIEASLDDGRIVEIYIPYTDELEARAFIRDE